MDTVAKTENLSPGTCAISRRGNLVTSRKSMPAAKPALATKIKLLPGESPDVLADVRELLTNADEWMNTPNTILGGRSPNELIGTPDEIRIRHILRGVKYSSME